MERSRHLDGQAQSAGAGYGFRSFRSRVRASGLIAPHPSLPQPGVRLFRAAPRINHAAANATIARATTVCQDEDMDINEAG
jgi:hypothetical protein